MPDRQIKAISDFFDRFGAAWAVIEGAGMAHGDRPTGALHKTCQEVREAKRKGYEPRELDPVSPSCLHVEVACWDHDGEF